MGTWWGSYLALCQKEYYCEAWGLGFRVVPFPLMQAKTSLLGLGEGSGTGPLCFRKGEAIALHSLGHDTSIS